MRALSAWLLASAVLAAGVARASDTSKEAKDKGTGISGSRESGGASGGSPAGSEGATTPDTGKAADRLATGKAEAKSWEIGASVEYHRLLTQNDLEGLAVNKNVNYWSIYAQYDVTKNDHLRLGFGLYERFLADAGESGVRTSDLSLSYAHGFTLPKEISLRVNAGTLFPTSFSAQLSSLILAPAVGLSLERSFGNLSLSVKGQARYYWTKYATEVGGNPNVQFETYTYLNAEYKLPFFSPISLGADVYWEWDRVYNMNSQGDTNPSVQTNGVERDATYPSQPIQQLYGGEVYARYDFALSKVKMDFTLAYANGDPTLGYNSAIHDGGLYVYPIYWRLSSEVYGVLSARY